MAVGEEGMGISTRAEVGETATAGEGVTAGGRVVGAGNFTGAAADFGMETGGVLSGFETAAGGFDAGNGVEGRGVEASVGVAGAEGGEGFDLIHGAGKGHTEFGEEEEVALLGGDGRAGVIVGVVRGEDGVKARGSARMGVGSMVARDNGIVEAGVSVRRASGMT